MTRRIPIGHKLEFSETRTIDPRRIPSTLEERNYAREVNKQIPGEWKAISRRVFRKYGIDRSPRSIKEWCEREENE